MLQLALVLQRNDIAKFIIQHVQLRCSVFVICALLLVFFVVDLLGRVGREGVLDLLR